MTIQFLLRALDNLLRHPIRYLVPVVVLMGLGITTTDSVDEYESVGVVFVEESSFLANLTDVRNDGFNYQSAAAIAADQLNSLMDIESFTVDVIRLASDDPEGGPYDSATIADVQDAVSFGAEPGSFLFITAAAGDPESAQALSAAVIEAYVDWQIEADVEGSSSAATFLTDLVDEYLSDVNAAELARSEWLAQNPDPVVGERSTTEQIELGSLDDDVTAARDRYESALANLQSAQLATTQTETDVRASFRVVDSPDLPTDTASSAVGSLVRVAFFVVIGLSVSLAALVITTFVDTSIRLPSEVRSRLDANLLAVVPRVR